MSTTSLTQEFDQKAATHGIMGVQQYYDLLTTLTQQTSGWGKTANVGAYLLPDITLVTEKKAGGVETSKNISVEKLYITIDRDQYPLESQRQMIIRELCRNYGGKTIGERELNSADFQAPGVWTLKQSNFEFDYLKVDPTDRTNSEHKPNPEAYRICYATTSDIKIPVQWAGGFAIATGGTIAVRERDIVDLCQALADVKAGVKTAAEALLTTNDKGALVSRFDVYGMEPGFLEKNYNPVSLKDTSLAAMATTQPASTAKTKHAPKHQ